jgi:hypothetical protein
MDKIAAHNVGAAFEAMLFSMALEPLAREFGALGAYGTGAIAQSIAQNDQSRFSALIAAGLERHD